MTTDPIRNVHPLGPAPAPATAPAGGERLEFQRLLERLEELARRETPPADDVETLRDAVRAADDDFAAAMDLRRRLEEAFRKHPT